MNKQKFEFWNFACKSTEFHGGNFVKREISKKLHGAR